MSAHCLFPAKCCRICSTECENIRNIFETTESGKRIVDMLEYCLQHPIDTSGCFPKCVCTECITSLIQTYQFFVLYKKSEEYFVSLYQNHIELTNAVITDNIKIETIELPEINEVLIKTEPPGVDFTIAANLAEDAIGSNGIANINSINVHPNRTKSKNNGITIVTIAGNEAVQRNITDRECFMCNLKFSKKSLLDEHLHTHTEEDDKKYMARKSVCSLCGKRYVNNYKLHKHMRSHTGERPFECICGGRFIDRACLRRHMRICPSHTLIPIEKKPFKSFEEKFEFDCKFCNRRFSSQECAQKHLETHTEEDKKLYNQRKYQCEIKECSKRFRERLFLERHMLIHTREQPHQCESCNNRYSDISSLKRHLQKCAPHLIKVNAGGPFKCPYCSSGLFTIKGWLTHKSSHTDLIHDCEYENCSESFRSSAEIKDHVKTVHAHELKSFQCDYDDKCLCSFSLKYLLDAHIDRHKRHSEHLCTECGKICSTSSALTTHKKNAHSNEKPIACGNCPQRFKEISQLKNHMTIHSGIKNFQCDICLKLFGHRSGLRNHKRTHSGDRNFVCEETDCHKSFYSKSVLIKHMRIHTGERPYKCDHCSRAFTQKGDMVKHMLIHLGPTPHKCTKCDASFRLQTELRKHSYSHYKASPME